LKGYFLIYDNSFQYLKKLMSPGISYEAASPIALFPCGLIKGILNALGLPADVTVKVTTMPACKLN
jgi:hypothetical protein